MSFPAIFLGLILATLAGAAYHLVRGGDVKRMLFFMGLAWIGFFAGNIFTETKGWLLWRLGELDIGFSLIGSFLVMGLADWLSNISTEDE